MERDLQVMKKVIWYRLKSGLLLNLDSSAAAAVLQVSTIILKYKTLALGLGNQGGPV